MSEQDFKAQTEGSFGMGPLSFDSPDSAMIIRAEYDPTTQVMTVEFKRPGSNVYVYGGIEPKLWQDFEQAASKGTFFARRIRPLYVGRAKA
jgi:hypothetical protein